MAGDWIKMRADLATSPKVVRIASALNTDRMRILGGLHAVWCLFDTHSEDGRLDGYTVATVDDLIGYPGFARAMADVGWLDEIAGAVVLPRFEIHNGASAKRRAMEADRKRSARLSAHDADKKRTREEKRREDIKELGGVAAPPLAVIDPTPIKPPKAKRKTALPEQFPVTAEMIIWANERAPAASITLETEKFCNHFHAKGETRADWLASWRNWMLNAQTYAGRRGGQGTRAGPDFDDLSWTQDLGGL
jgi:hypothetical protein